jgi:hypothetical protein
MSLYSNTTGCCNIALGSLAGRYLTTGSWNIDIGNEGAVGESNTIRICGYALLHRGNLRRQCGQRQ